MEQWINKDWIKSTLSSKGYTGKDIGLYYGLIMYIKEWALLYFDGCERVK